MGQMVVRPKIQELTQSKEKACTLLQNDKQALWNLLSASFSKRMDYWAALVYHTDLHKAAQDFDLLIQSYLEAATGLTIPFTDSGGGFECSLDLPIQSLNNQSIQSHISQLPISKGGLGLRKISATSLPAFVGGIELSLPFFTGDLGIAPALEEVIGRPDRGTGARWAELIRHNTRTGRELAAAWNKMKDDAQERCTFVEDDLCGTILNAEASSAGDGSTQTKAIKYLESLHHKSVHKGLQLHHNQNAKPIKRFKQRDKVSQAWLSALCSPMSSIPSPEFTQAMAWHLFLPSPSCSPFVGQMVAGKPLDPFGEVLMTAPLPFDS